MRTGLIITAIAALWATPCLGSAMISVNGQTDINSIIILVSDTVTIGVEEPGSEISSNYTIYLNFGLVSDGDYSLSNPRFGPAAGKQSFFVGPYWNYYDQDEIYISLVNPDPCGTLFLTDLHAETPNQDVQVELWDNRKGYDQPADTLKIYITDGSTPFSMAYPKNVYMFAETDQPDACDQTLTIISSGEVEWMIEHDCDWLSVDPCQGTTPGGTDLVTLSANATNLDIGRYDCTLTIKDPCTLHIFDEVDVILWVRKDDGILNVPTEYPDIQTAISNAEDGDSVVIAEGIYTGRGNRDMIFVGLPITVRSTDPSDSSVVDSTIIDCGGSEAEPHRGFLISGGGSGYVIDGLTITNGYADYGGAIYVHNYNELTARNCFFLQNTADYGGGGIFSELGTIYADYCTFVGNQALDTGYFGGGGICSIASPVYISHCVFNGNTTQSEGGGVYVLNEFGVSIVENCTFYKNSASIEGGAYSSHVACYAPDSTLRNSIIWDNEPNDDAGIYTIPMGKCPAGGIYADLSILQKNWTNGTGIIVADPCFADPNNDCHLKSQAGRWDPISKNWVQDDVTSIAIDAGDPNADWTKELWPHGKRINIGAYGGTPEASMSLSTVGNIANLDNDPCDIVDINDLAVFVSKWCYEEYLLAEDLDRDGRVDFKDLAIFGNEPYESRTSGQGLSFSIAPCDMELSSKSITTEETRFTVTVEGHYIHFEDMMVANCCPDMVWLDMTVNGNLIILYEHEYSPEPCRCVCDYPVDATLGPFKRGIYTLEVYEDWGGFIGQTSFNIE